MQNLMIAKREVSLLLKQPQSKRTRERQKSTGPSTGPKRKSISVEFNMNDPEHRALYKMVQSAGDVNAFFIRLLKQMNKRLRKRRARHASPLSDKVLDQIKQEVESKEEEEVMRPIFLQADKHRK